MASVSDILQASQRSQSLSGHTTLSYESRIRATFAASSTCTPVDQLRNQYSSHAGRVVNATLPYENAPPKHRRVEFGDFKHPGIVAISHVLQRSDDIPRVISCTGFCVSMLESGTSQPRIGVVTCAHTLLEVPRSAF